MHPHTQRTTHPRGGSFRWHYGGWQPESGRRLDPLLRALPTAVDDVSPGDEDFSAALGSAVPASAVIRPLSWPPEDAAVVLMYGLWRGDSRGGLSVTRSLLSD